MTFFDWFWAGVAATLGWFALPFIIVGVVILLVGLIVTALVLWNKAARGVRRVKAIFK